jgi:hypothetical protein
MLSPEEVELANKKAELQRLSEDLAERTLEFEDIKLKVARFQKQYSSEVGSQYVRLDELRAQIAELRARQNPQRPDLTREAQAAREAATQTRAEHLGMSTPTVVLAGSDVPDETKALYRRIASTIHPDKATQESSRRLCTRLMAELNDAYARRDSSRMQFILAEWQQSPETVEGQGTAADLVRVIRAIAQVRRGIDSVAGAIADLVQSEIHALMLRVSEAEKAGRHILSEMAVRLDRDIATAEADLTILREVAL